VLPMCLGFRRLRWG